MTDTNKKTGPAFKIVSISTIVLFVLYFIVFLLFGLFALNVKDPDIKEGLGAVFSYHFSDIGGLFSFNFHNASNVIYVFLSGILYFLLAITLIYIVVGIIFIIKRKRLIIIAGIIASLVAIYVYLMLATGLPKYWYIINGRAPFESDNPLVGPTFLIILFGSLYIIFAYVLYFYSLSIAVKTVDPRVKQVEEKEEKTESNNDNQPVEEEQPVVFEEVSLDQEQTIFNNKQELENMIKEVVRDIVRDEIARNNANLAKSGPNPSGFGNPVVVQYFNSDAMPVENKKETPKQEKPIVKAEPVKQEVLVPAPVKEEKKPIIRIPFIERMLSADKEMQDNYNELKNEILSYGVNSRVSNGGDTFRLHRVTYIKLTIAGLSLKLYFALNPEDYKDSTIPVQDAGHKGIYAEIPLVFKVKSGLSMRRCKQLIQDVFEKNGFEQGEVKNINWVDELKKSPNDDSEEN